MNTNYAGLTLCLARRLAIADKAPQQATIVQTAARLLSSADAETKDSLMRLISASPSERQRVLNLTEALFLGGGK